MSLASRITRQPIPFDRPAAEDFRLGLSGFVPQVQDLMVATAGCSPYLRGLMQREAEWLRGAVEAPEAALEAELAGLDGVAVDLLPMALRAAKRRIAALSALCDLGGVWPLELVTGSLTRLALPLVEEKLKRLVVSGAVIKTGRPFWSTVIEENCQPPRP